MPNMRLFKSKNTRLEQKLRKALFSRGFRYVLHDRYLPGSPDIVLPKYQAVIFVNGCFWHHHPCDKGQIPKTNTAYWRLKFAQNIIRDRRARAELKKLGWRHLTVWECSLLKEEPFTFDELIDFLECWIISSAHSCDVSGQRPLPILRLDISSNF
ncbi:DNA mismatch endonuclease Vsr [Photobacterium sp. WH24]|uniref:very short patch repair endonuclease n=1 Tax=Photobacterium sp. WH24 TaxID=2827237 RepID=UPI001C4871EB|nr:DNA mismatch endonuclease Vsr [Photobacterium sp. WH24]